VSNSTPVNKLMIAGLFALLGFKNAATSGLYSSHSRKYVITHFNITFAPDLSNRVNPELYRRPLNDVDLLKLVTNDLYPVILRYKRSEDQKDKLLVDFINKGLINQYSVNTDKLLIDFGKFPNQNSRINYIMERDHVRRTLRQDIKNMVSEFSRINELAVKQNFGADIWTYLNEGIDNKIALPQEASRVQDGSTYINAYRNILILATDGYIEAGIYGKGFDLSKRTIDRFRNAFLASGENDMKAFFHRHKEFRIKPVHNDYLKNIEILVMELYDRSLSKAGSATVHPTDMEIMKLFWTDWLQQSKVKRFELHPCANSKDEAEKIILDFLGINKTQ
jgi:hypothetical protein